MTRDAERGKSRGGKCKRSEMWKTEILINANYRR